MGSKQIELEGSEGSDKTPETPKKEEKTLDKSKVYKEIGRCFEVSDMEIGIGSTSQVQEGVDVHYYIEMLANGSMALEMVDDDGDPTGKLLDEISIQEFAKRFQTCSMHNCPLQVSTLDEISKKMAKNRAKMGDEHLEKGELKEAEDKFKRALAFDEENVKAKFGLGKTHMEQGKTDEAMEIFNELSQIDALFEEENKHVFNEFGIELRKLEKYDLAIANYEKSITIDPLDEALYFNLARAYDKKDLLSKAIEKLKEALKINEDFPEAQSYLSVLIEKEKKMIKDLSRTKIDDFS